MSRQATEMLKRSGPAEPASVKLERRLIEALAYQNWLERGCPIGSDQEDWFQAEAQLRTTQTDSQAA